MVIRNGEGEVIHDKVSLAESGRTPAELNITGSHTGWSLFHNGDQGGGKCMLRFESILPAAARKPLWLSVTPDRFFWPSVDELKWE